MEVILDGTGEDSSKTFSTLFRTVGTWDDVMETRVQDNLHAPIYLGPCDYTGIDLASDTGMDA